MGCDAMTHRFFRADANAYEGVRVALDQAWGMAGNGTTCIEPLETAPRDSAGNILLGVHAEFCTWHPADELLAACLLHGEAVEISAGDYFGALPHP